KSVREICRCSVRCRRVSRHVFMKIAYWLYKCVSACAYVCVCVCECVCVCVSECGAVEALSQFSFLTSVTLLCPCLIWLSDGVTQTHTHTHSHTLSLSHTHTDTHTRTHKNDKKLENCSFYVSSFFLTISHKCRLR